MILAKQEWKQQSINYDPDDDYENHNFVGNAKTPLYNMKTLVEEVSSVCPNNCLIVNIVDKLKLGWNDTVVSSW